MVEGARRFTGERLLLPTAPVGDDRRPLSSLAQWRLLEAAVGLVGAVEGLSKVDELEKVAARVLAEPYARLRLELERAGAIKSKEQP